MRNVSAKVYSYRTATAQSTIRVSRATIETIRRGEAPKGDPLPVARVAAIQAAKNTPQIMPYCHSMPIEHVEVSFELLDEHIISKVNVKSSYRTGVEMEAMAGAAVAALNFYDMLKLIDDDMVIEKVELLFKSGGKSDMRRIDSFPAAVLSFGDDSNSGLLESALKAHGGIVESACVTSFTGETVVDKIQQYVQSGARVVITTGAMQPNDRLIEAIVSHFSEPLFGATTMLLNYHLDRYPRSIMSAPIVGRIGVAIVICLPNTRTWCEDMVECLLPYVLSNLAGGDTE